MDGHQSSGSLAVLPLGLGLLGGCSAGPLDAGGRSETAAFGRAVEYEAVSCWFEAPSEREVSSGWLAVPEDWAAENSRAIHLPVVVCRAASGGARQEPVLFLNGGPVARSRIESEQEIAWWLGPNVFGSRTNPCAASASAMGSAKPVTTCAGRGIS
jgi:hypothetical protein